MTTTTKKKYSTSWYKSNLGDRQAILNLIGAFTSENPLEIHLRKDCKIGRIRVFISTPWHGYQHKQGKRVVLKKHMWLGSMTRLYTYPDQVSEARQMLKVLAVIRRSHDSQVQDWSIKLGTLGSKYLLDPVIQKYRVPERVDALYDVLNELVSTHPYDWRLTWDTPFENREYNPVYEHYVAPLRSRPLATYDHPVM